MIRVATNQDGAFVAVVIRDCHNINQISLKAETEFGLDLGSNFARLQMQWL
jgi:hypothetical protein